MAKNVVCFVGTPHLFSSESLYQIQKAVEGWFSKNNLLAAKVVTFCERMVGSLRILIDGCYQEWTGSGVQYQMWKMIAFQPFLQTWTPQIRMQRAKSRTLCANQRTNQATQQSQNKRTSILTALNTQAHASTQTNKPDGKRLSGTRATGATAFDHLIFAFCPYMARNLTLGHSYIVKPPNHVNWKPGSIILMCVYCLFLLYII